MVIGIKHIKIIEIVVIVSILQINTCFPNGCRPGFIQRNIQSKHICCRPIVCAVGQMYDFCKENDGNDVCMSCPEGTYHKDVIDTAKMPFVIDPCVVKPSCHQPEVTKFNDKCVCDRKKGYFGEDPHNCRLSEVQCNSPGFELTDNGKCELCKTGFFKPEIGSNHICREQTSCKNNQETVSNGSATEDRTCKNRTRLQLHYTSDADASNSYVLVKRGDIRKLKSDLESVKHELKELKEIKVPSLEMLLVDLRKMIDRLERRRKRKKRLNKLFKDKRKKRKDRKKKNGKRKKQAISKHIEENETVTIIISLAVAVVIFLILVILTIWKGSERLVRLCIKFVLKEQYSLKFQIYQTPLTRINRWYDKIFPNLTTLPKKRCCIKCRRKTYDGEATEIITEENLLQENEITFIETSDRQNVMNKRNRKHSLNYVKDGSTIISTARSSNNYERLSTAVEEQSYEPQSNNSNTSNIYQTINNSTKENKKVSMSRSDKSIVEKVIFHATENMTYDIALNKQECEPPIT